MSAIQKDEFSAAFQKAAKILSRRMHSSYELRAKLLKNFSPVAVEKAIAELQRLSYLDDERFAESYAAELRGKGLGRLMIKSRLARRGIAGDICERLLCASVGEDEAERAAAFLKSRAKNLARIADNRSLKEKIFRMLKSRGFSTDAIIKAMDGFCADCREE